MSQNDLSPAEVDVLWAAPLGHYESVEEIRKRIKETRRRENDLATLAALLTKLARKGYLLEWK